LHFSQRFQLAEQKKFESQASTSRKDLTTEQGSIIQKMLEQERSHVPQTTKEKVKEAGKTVSYGGVWLVGIAVTGSLVYFIVRELFSEKSPMGIYTKSFKLIKQNQQVIDALGEPIKGYGELTTRMRRRHVAHQPYEKDGINYMRMQFYVEGPVTKGVACLEMKENESKRYEYRYLYVELAGHPKKVIVLIDNR